MALRRVPQRRNRQFLTRYRRIPRRRVMNGRRPPPSSPTRIVPRQPIIRLRKAANTKVSRAHSMLSVGIIVAIALALVQYPITGDTGARGPRGTAGADGSGGGGIGSDGFNSLVSTASEGPGPNCDVSGQKIDSGLDNGDGGGIASDSVLQGGEIDDIGYVCDGLVGSNGANGFDSIAVTISESPGVNCANGGYKVRVGQDNGDGGGTARNGILEAGETDQTFYLCNGDAGADGTAGAQGYAALVVVTTESPGGNCAAGGKKVEVGLDNGDGGGTAGDFVLQAGEIDSTSYVCNGTNGTIGSDGYNSLVASEAEGVGVNCAYAGRKITSGLDNGDGGGTARDGILQSGEIDVTSYVCNGVDGYNTIMISASEAIGVNCANGGRKLTSGLDNGDGGGTSRNGVLEVGEVDVTSYACNGIDMGLLYTYNTGTSGDPGTGKFGFDTVTLSAIVTLRISETDGDGNAISAIIATWDDSTSTVRSIITVLGNGVPTRMLTFTITSAITDNGAYDSFTVAHVSNAGSHANNDVDRIRQQRTGDKGDTGTAGTAGAGFTVVDSLTVLYTQTSTTGTEVTGLTNSITAGIYVITYYLICRTAATGTGIDFGINFDSTQDIIIINMEYQDSGTTATTGLADGTVAGDGGELLMGRSSTLTESTTTPNLNGITGVVSASEDFMVFITLIVKPTATGEIELWVATDVAASQVDVRIGSSVTIIKTG